MKIPLTNIEISVSRNASGDPRGLHTNKGGVTLQQILGNQGLRIAPQDLWQIYRRNADVFSCIREWRQSVGDGGYKFVTPQDKEAEVTGQDRDFIEAFFKNSKGLKRFLATCVRDVGICGNAYFEIVESHGDKPFGLLRLDPRTMFVVANRHGQILRYFQRVVGADPVEFQPSQVFHVTLEDDPDNELLGFSNLETALIEARTDIAAGETNYYFFENDAVPSVLYITEDGADANSDESQAALDSIKATFGGARNRNKAGILSGIKEVKVLSMSQKDMEFVVGRKFNTDKVCSVFGVPKFILGYSETVNYSSGAKLLEKFYRGTIQPIENAIEDQINSQLFEKLGIAQKVYFKFLPQSFGEESETTRLALEELKSGAITLRQYKVKTGQNVTTEDEQEPMLDRHIIHSGASAILMEDVGVDPVVDPNDEEAAQNMVNLIEERFQKYEEETL